MDVFEAVDSRISCRWFLDRPVDHKIVRELIGKAARAASGGNLQPWRVYALTGTPLAEIKRRVAAHISGDHDPRHDEAEYPIYPNPIWDPYKSRREEHGVQLYGALKIARDDAKGRLDQYKRNFQFFNAPVALFITIERKLGPGQWADLGSYIHTLMYLARGYGLDTCPQESWARMYRIVGEFLSVPPTHMLFCAVAIGYGDYAHPANSFRSPRAAPEEFCTFVGFEGS
jgi:nitroreductase